MKKNKTQETTQDKINDLFDEHVAFVNDLLRSQQFTEDVETEIEAAGTNLQNKILKLVEHGENFWNLVEKLKTYAEDEGFAKNELSVLYDLIQEQEDDFLKCCGEAPLSDELSNRGYIFLKLESAEHRQKLEDFIRAEIFPFYNEQYSANTNLF